AQPLLLQRLDRGERGKRRVAIVTDAAAVKLVATPYGRPRSGALGPADHFGLLVEVTVEQHGVAAGSGRFHQDHGRALLEPDDLDGEALDGALARPAAQELDGAIDVAVLAPLRVEHRGLRRNLDVFVQRGNDALVPRLLNEVANLTRIERHRWSSGGD